MAKILVLHGSPKGDISVTMQYIRYAQKEFPEHTWDIECIGAQIQSIAENTDIFQKIISKVRNTDAIIWSFPVYFLLIPSQLKRFIDLVQKKQQIQAFHDKYAMTICTSIHFFDHTATQYMQQVSEDWDMKYVGSFSAEMYDLLRPVQRKQYRNCMATFLSSVVTHAPTRKNSAKLVEDVWKYAPNLPNVPIDTKGKKVKIVVDAESDQNLITMVQYLKGCYDGNVRVVSLQEICIKAGCLGCMHCGYDNKCIYENTDTFSRFYLDEILTADVVLYAGTIRNRYLSWSWKQFFDRRFFLNHIPSLAGKQLGFILSGPYRQLQTLQEVLQGYTEVEGANFLGVCSDDMATTSEQLSELLHNFADMAIAKSVIHYAAPETFLFAAGKKLFRDEVWESMRIVFSADHRYYKKNGLYNFPRRTFSMWLLHTFVEFCKLFPSFRNKFYSKRLQTDMIRPFEKLFTKK